MTDAMNPAQRGAARRRYRALDTADVAYTPGERDGAALVERAEYLQRPASNEAECATLGAIQGDVYNDYFADISEIVSPDDFYDPRHQVIFAAMKRIYERGDPIDLATLQNELECADEVDQAGGIAYATSFSNACPVIERGVYYAALVAKHARRRRMSDAILRVWQRIQHPNITAEDGLALALDELQPLADEFSDSARLDGGVITLEQLMQMETPEMNWPIAGILPEGLCIIGAPPKTGKSALALQLALSIASGGPALGNAATTQGEVLYLALEDSPARLKERIERQLCGDPLPTGVHIKLSGPPMLAGGLVQIESWLRGHPQAQAVIIDTLGRFRGVGSQTENGNLFSADYEDMARLQRLGLKHHVAVIALHHLTKNKGASDPLEALSGTMGMSAPADVVWIINRERNQETGQLQIVGRDVTEQSIAIKLSSLTLTWQAIGDAADVAMKEGEMRTIEALQQIGRAASPSEIATVTEERPGTVKTRCFRMKQNGLLVTVGTGKYWLSSPNSRGVAQNGLQGYKTVTEGS